MKRAINMLGMGVLVAFMMSFTTTSTPDTTGDKVVGTYQGVNDDGYFMFKSKNGKTVVFHMIDDDVEVDLYDDGNEGGEFEVTWVAVEVEEYDDEGEPTGQSFSGKKITHLKEM